MTDEDIINAVCNHDSPSADSESSTPEDPDLISDDDLDADSNDDGVAANESEIIHTSNQFLWILDQMKAYALRNQLSWEAHTSIDNLSSILVQSKVWTARIQTDISTYFNLPQRWTSVAFVCICTYLANHVVSKYMHIYLLITPSCVKTINKFYMIHYSS